MKYFRADPLHHHYFDDQRIGLVDYLFIKRDRQRACFNRDMFDQDFKMLFQHTNRHSSGLFEIVSTDDEFLQSLLGNVRTRYAPNTVDETIRELVEEIAQALIRYGRAFYFFYNDSEQDKFNVASVNPLTVVRLFGSHIQWVTKRLEPHWDRADEELSREARILDAAKLMCFTMPKFLKRLLSRQNRTLAVLDKHQFGSTHFHPLATHENPNPSNHFDFRAWSDTQERALFRATRYSGWSGRKYVSPKRSDFFGCHRMIRFRRNQLLLRDGILCQLSNELSRIGNGFQPEFSVEITTSDKLPKVAQLNDLEMRLEREEVGFTEIIDYCLQH